MFLPIKTQPRWDQLLAPLFHGSSLWSAADSSAGKRLPCMNVWETEDAFHAEVELPGVQQDDLDVTCDGGEVTIKAEVKNELPEGATSHRRERFRGTFHRVVRLPVELDAEKIDARLTDGVLTLELPKLEVTAPRKIEVRAS